jgi:hypothetical protein
MSRRNIMSLRVIQPCREDLPDVEAGGDLVNTICGKFCWQIIKGVDASLFNICSDCLIYLTGQSDTFLSKQMQLNIKMHREEDLLNNKTCQLIATIMRKQQQGKTMTNHA